MTAPSRHRAGTWQPWTRGALWAVIAFGSAAAWTVEPAVTVAEYADHVQRSYARALDDARGLRSAVERLVRQPDEANLAGARRAWTVARTTYGRTEAFRFSAGPIDIDPDTGLDGPEVRLNAWPVNEAGIDAVEGRPASGLIHERGVPVDRDTLIGRNGRRDEKDVMTGFHAIEFLLWGQDLADDGPGARPATDFAGTSRVAQRRRRYLQVATELLVDDLAWLESQWRDRPNGFRQRFTGNAGASLGAAWNGLVKLSGFELAMERLAVPLESGDQEDEHSCFSDTTHIDFTANVGGIADVYRGHTESAPGLRGWLVSRDRVLADRIDRQLQVVEKQVAALHVPFDRVLAAERTDERRIHAERLVDSLLRLSDLLGAARSLALAEARGDGP